MHKIGPLPQKIETVKGKAKKVAKLLTSPENLEKRKVLSIRKKQKVEQSCSKAVQSRPIPSGIGRAKQSQKKTGASKRRNVESSSEEDGFSIHDSSSDIDMENVDENVCKGCGEDYNFTKKGEDWIQCIHCHAWLHEGCTKYLNIGQPCGKMLLMTK